MVANLDRSAQKSASGIKETGSMTEKLTSVLKKAGTAVPLAAFLIGATASGILLGLTLNNAGGAWDNAKKVIESRSEDGKGTATHEAAVIGDTVGDPTKDTAGPSIHVLIKLVNTIAITIVPVLVVVPPLIPI